MTFPIAGSRPRGATPGGRRKFAKELLADPKGMQRAHHARRPVVSQRPGVRCACRSPWKSAAHGHQAFQPHHAHLLDGHRQGRPSLTVFDVFKSAFLAGIAVWRAPKPRAVEIIDELEPADRGIYGGTVGYPLISPATWTWPSPSAPAFLRDHEGEACRPVPALCSTPCPPPNGRRRATRPRPASSPSRSPPSANCNVQR